jgi:hypothetical protein
MMYLDGLWYAINKSRPPRSKKFEASEFLENEKLNPVKLNN